MSFALAIVDCRRRITRDTCRSLVEGSDVLRNPV